MSTTDDDFYRGWWRPGPDPPGGVEPGEDETLEYISGRFRIFQYASGHRYSTDDVLTAWYGTQWAPRAERIADLGSGIGSVAIIAAWRLPGATVTTIEAQERSLRLARKSILYDGLGGRVTALEGDIRDTALLASLGSFDLVFGSPPYFAPGAAVAPDHPQAVDARIEMRGSVADYARAARQLLAAGGVFAFVFPFAELRRAEAALAAAGLVAIRRREVIFKEGAPALLSLFIAMREEDVPEVVRSRPPFVEPALVIRDASGATTHEYSAVRMSFGFPPGVVGAAD